jgi:hypothetical protein
MSLEQIVGQMIFAPFQSTYLSSDTDAYEQLVKLVHETQIGGVIAFGGSEPIPQVMLNNTYGASCSASRWSWRRPESPAVDLDAAACSPRRISSGACRCALPGRRSFRAPWHLAPPAIRSWRMRPAK